MKIRTTITTIECRSEFGRNVKHGCFHLFLNLFLEHHTTQISIIKHVFAGPGRERKKKIRINVCAWVAVFSKTSNAKDYSKLMASDKRGDQENGILK